MPCCWPPATRHHWESQAPQCCGGQPNPSSSRRTAAESNSGRAPAARAGPGLLTDCARQQAPVRSLPRGLNTNTQADKQTKRAAAHPSCVCKNLEAPNLGTAEGEQCFNENFHKSDSSRPGPHNFQPRCGHVSSPSIRLHSSDLTEFRNPQACSSAGRQPARNPRLAAVTQATQEAANLEKPGLTYRSFLWLIVHTELCAFDPTMIS